MYAVFKHLHVSFVILSGAGFFLRGVLMMNDAPLLQRRWIKLMPHVVDTGLLAAAIVLVVMSEQYPFVAPWVTAKIFGLIAYIILGSLALKAGRTRRIRVTAWIAAMAVFGYVVSVALTKTPLGLLNWVAGG